MNRREILRRPVVCGCQPRRLYDHKGTCGDGACRDANCGGSGVQRRAARRSVPYVVLNLRHAVAVQRQRSAKRWSLRRAAGPHFHTVQEDSAVFPFHPRSVAAFGARRGWRPHTTGRRRISRARRFVGHLIGQFIGQFIGITLSQALFVAIQRYLSLSSAFATVGTEAAPSVVLSFASKQGASTCFRAAFAGA